MNSLTVKRDHEWLLSQGFTSNQPVCQQLPYAVYINPGCYTYSKTVAIRGINDTLCVMRQILVPDENSAWAAILNGTASIFNGSAAHIGVGSSPKAAIDNLAHKENVPIQMLIDVYKPLEEVPNITPEE